MNAKTSLTSALLALLFLIVHGACAPEPPPAALPEPPAESDGPPNVVLFIGDGFGVGAWSLAREWAATRGEKLSFEDPEALGFLVTRAADVLVTDSGAAATAWSTAGLGECLRIGREGERPLGAILHEAGRAYGLVTTAKLTHATPAPFYGAVASRYDEAALAEQLLAARPDVALGGGRQYFTSTGAGGKRKDGRDLLSEAEVEGIYVQTTFETPLPVDRPVLGVYATRHLPHALDRTNEPDLVDLVKAALARLRATGKPWFLLVEEAHIDVASHDHDGPGVAANTLRLDRTLAHLLEDLDFDRTLLVLGADHATDSPAWLEWAKPESLDVATMSVERMEHRIFGGEPWAGTPRGLEHAALPILDEGARQTGLSLRDLDRLLSAKSHYDRKTAIGDAISRRFGISFIDYDDHLNSTVVHGHTGEPVPVRAWGHRADEVQGVRDHGELGVWLREVMELRSAPGLAVPGGPETGTGEPEARERGAEAAGGAVSPPAGTSD